VTAQLVWRQLSGMNVAEQAELPRRRVVNKQWVISALKLGEKGQKQIRHLEAEWIKVKENQVDMGMYAYGFEEILEM
jgi:alkylated DNA nucleotide flippase Atl1